MFKKYEKPTDENPNPSYWQFYLTCGIAMSLTAFPVLARILAEMQLMSTTVGFITVCAAAAMDIAAWILLALLVSLINATTPIMPLYVVLMAIGWMLVLVYAVRPLLMSLVRLTHSEEEPSQKMIAITLVVVLTSAFVTHIIGIHSIFGGFLVGLLIPHDSGFAEGLTRRIEDLIGVYFLPIFFACSGRKTQVNLLNNAETWGLVVLTTLVSFAAKMIGCISAAKLNGMTWREALSIGFLMNCKGLVEYIVLNIGHDAGVISERVFVIMVSMCLVLTMISTPFVRYLYPVSYQKELEVRREAERKNLANQPKKSTGEGDGHQVSTGGILSSVKDKLRLRKGPKNPIIEKVTSASDNNYEDLDGIRIDSPDQNTSRKDLPSNTEPLWKKKNAIMFCLDKTPNAPGVMTLLQLFSGTASTSGSKHNFNSTREVREMERSAELSREKYQGVLQPSIDISDVKGNSRSRTTTNVQNEYEIRYSNVYAIRLLHISERTSAAMLTASRCMDRLYKDTVMMMVMAFAKLNSIPLKPLVAISTDTAQSTVTHDILDRAEDLNVGWIVFPWNSSHLSELPTIGPTTIPLSAINTQLTSHSAVSIPGTPSVPQESNMPRLVVGGSTDRLNETPRQLAFNISQYFDHDESQKIASGGHVDLSQGSQNHRISIASNTKVLSKLIPASAESGISTAVLVDRGLGLFGGVEHIIVMLMDGEDDYEALCLSSCLARNTRCFVTILRVTGGRRAGLLDGQSRLSQNRLDRSMPPTPDAAGPSRQHNRPIDAHVPKDDSTLFKTFFPRKTPVQGGQSYYQRRFRQNTNTDKYGFDLGIDSGEYVAHEEGVISLPFQELADALQWARTWLTPQDLIVIGFDSNILPLQSSGHIPSSAFHSRSPSVDGSMLETSDKRVASPSQPNSPPTILERRGITLSPQSETLQLPSSHQRLNPMQDTHNLSAASTPAGGPAIRASFDEERPGRSRTTDSRVESSFGKSARSLRSLSRGRKGDGHITSGGPINGGPPTTCQTMLGLTADKMIQSYVVSSLLIVRSRWHSQRGFANLNDVGSPSSGIGQFRLHNVPTSGVSHNRNFSNDYGSVHERILDQTRQYHSQQQQHHSRQNSKPSQDYSNDLDSKEKRSAEKSKVPDVTFIDMIDVDDDDELQKNGHSQA
ncbi:K(+)/H(+) antiporter [Entomortierella beljakovae]|nr:K(+)/H(+) antiporter [Entomortierella beljakovae]